MFRDVTLPLISTAVVAGAMLAFALSFDEVIVTTFTAGAQSTLPIWIFGQIRHGHLLPEVNVVVSFVILVTIIPVAVAARLTGGGGMTRASAGTTGGVAAGPALARPTARPLLTSPWAPTSPEPAGAGEPAWRPGSPLAAPRHVRSCSEEAAVCLRREWVCHVGQVALRSLLVVEVLIGHNRRRAIRTLTGSCSSLARSKARISWRRSSPWSCSAWAGCPMLAAQHRGEAWSYQASARWAARCTSAWATATAAFAGEMLAASGCCPDCSE